MTSVIEMTKHLIGSDWLAGPVLQLAPEILGNYLVREMDGRVERRVICEVEAYDGMEDLACHASRGKTPRTEVMFGPAGRWYVYLCYGVHWMLNVVTGPVDYPAAILIRGLREVSGPGRLTKALKVDGSLNRLEVSPKSGLWLEFNPEKDLKQQVRRSPRIGVNYAGPDWSQRPYRFELV